MAWRLLILILTLGLCSTRGVAQEADTLVVRELPPVYVGATPKVKPLTREERQELWRRIRDVKRTMPYAKYVVATIIETYEYLETLPEKEQRDHLKRVERELRAELEPKMRQLTLGQGKMMMKIIKRQSGSTCYELLKAFTGGWKAWWWNQFARIVGASLKTDYNPAENPDDATTERIIRLVEQGRL